MEFDLTEDERGFIIQALGDYLMAFPEYRERMSRLMDLIHDCGEAGTTLHLN